MRITSKTESLRLWCAALCMCVFALSVGAADIGPLAQPPSHPDQDAMDVLHCDLSMMLEVGMMELTGGALTMTAQSVSGDLTQCVLDLNDNDGLLIVSAVEASPSALPLVFDHASDEERIYVTLASPVASGEEFSLTVFYSGVPRIQPFGGLFGIRRSGVPTIFSQSQPYAARLWWPCKDHPSDKFTIDFHISVEDLWYNDHPLSVVCNGALQDVEDNGDGTTTYHWSSRPIHTQYVSINCTNFQTLSGTYTGIDGLASMEITHHFFPEVYDPAFDPVAETIEAMEFFADRFGEYPFIDEKYATVSWPRSIGLENQTASSLHTDDVFSNYSVIAVHELAHMWFGCAVGVEEFDHLWLAEGWATYCESLFIEHREGEEAFREHFDPLLTIDAYPIISDRADEFSVPIIYNKAAWVLHMLRRILGDDDFFLAARNFVNDPDHRYGTALTDDFREHCEAVSGRDLSWFFDQWLLRASHPICVWMWKWRPDGPTNVIDLTINQIQADLPYILPVEFEIEFTDGTTTSVMVTNEFSLESFVIDVGTKIPMVMTFDPENWILDDNFVMGVPDAPTLRSVSGDASAESISVTWDAPLDPEVIGHRLYVAHGVSGEWMLAADEVALASPETTHTLTAVSREETIRIRVTALADGEGLPSDTYTVRLASEEADVLIVDGYDRWNSLPISAGRNHDIGALHGASIGAAGYSHDSCANEAISQEIDLGDYETVVWFVGDEGASEEALSVDERALITDHLQSGGHLFITGNRIAWSLSGQASGETASPEAVEFLADILHAEFGEEVVSPTALDASGEVFSIGNAVYSLSPEVGQADSLLPVLCETASAYAPSGNAGIQARAYFGSDGPRGTLVYLGVGFERIASTDDRDEIMASVLDWLLSEPGVSGVVFPNSL